MCVSLKTRKKLSISNQAFAKPSLKHRVSFRLSIRHAIFHVKRNQIHFFERDLKIVGASLHHFKKANHLAPV